jgi:hypothetical protein
MLLAPIGKVPAAIDMDALAIGIELDISGIGDLVWPAAAEGCPEEEEHPAATSASTPTPTTIWKAETGRERPGDEAELNMDRPPQVPNGRADGRRHRRLR